jgi:hypothetical protein
VLVQRVTTTNREVWLGYNQGLHKNISEPLFTVAEGKYSATQCTINHSVDRLKSWKWIGGSVKYNHAEVFVRCEATLGAKTPAKKLRNAAAD